MYEHEKHLVGVYETEHEVIQAVEDLKKQGYASEDISVIGKNKDDVNEINDVTGTTTEKSAMAGAATGGALGGVLGLLAGVGALAIPGIGPLVAAGPIAATLTGAAAGAGVGGLAGVLIGLGIPKEEADRYEDLVKEGKFLVVVERRENRVGEGQTVDTSGTIVSNDPYTTPVTSLNQTNTNLRNNRDV
ncbi:general stress protein [Neobacillus cucumis]|uniref:general stress protein n=1 Tax=Neobacillus cucumis TaxID=1740721 RepID=UPI00203DDB3F|nr:general stress protein [Neobacillus cucumis]MCM3727086.1 general stress protein [Neobacillus cucumis]